MKETIARGVSNGQLAYVGKTGSGKYLPFNFERTITASDVEISEEMFIITKETAEAYRARAAQPATPPPVQPSIPGIEAIGGSNSQPTSLNSGSGAGEPTVPSGAKGSPGPTQLPLELSWSGEVPSQKWMNFYTKFLTKLGVGDSLP